VSKLLSRIYGILCGPLEIPGEPPVVHLDHIENHSPIAISLQQGLQTFLSEGHIN